MVALRVVALLVGMVFETPEMALPEETVLVLETVLVVVPIVAFRVVVLLAGMVFVTLEMTLLTETLLVLATVLAVILRMEIGF
jgi:hypothetical protein